MGYINRKPHKSYEQLEDRIARAEEIQLYTENRCDALEKENKKLKEEMEMMVNFCGSCKQIHNEQLNKMKCCANCKHSEEDNKSSTICDECFELCYWEMKE